MIYNTDEYALNGKDEVLQFKKNRREMGHITRHLDGKGNLLKENRYGIIKVPSDAVRL